MKKDWKRRKFLLFINISNLFEVLLEDNGFVVLFVVVVTVFRPNKRGLSKCVVVWFEFDGYWYIGWCNDGGILGPVSCKVKLIWDFGLFWITE